MSVCRPAALGLAWIVPWCVTAYVRGAGSTDLLARRSGGALDAPKEDQL